MFIITKKEKNYTGNRRALFVRVVRTAISLTNPHAIFTSRLSEGYTRSAGSVDMIVTWLYVREPRNRTSGS